MDSPVSLLSMAKLRCRLQTFLPAHFSFLRYKLWRHTWRSYIRASHVKTMSRGNSLGEFWDHVFQKGAKYMRYRRRIKHRNTWNSMERVNNKLFILNQVEIYPYLKKTAVTRGRTFPVVYHAHFEWLIVVGVSRGSWVWVWVWVKVVGFKKIPPQKKKINK